MQWIALDKSKKPITAAAARKQTRYSCPECSCPVQLRSGPHRQPHFYHVQPRSTCAQHKKTEEHLGLQLWLASRIASSESCMERPFPEIRRIADVAWEERKIVFEVQCSPMTREEAEQRCTDYRSIGWEVLWILSDARFNRRKLSPAERFLRSQTCYFSHWSKTPLLYDQYEILEGFRRVYQGHRLAIDPLLAVANIAKIEPDYPLPVCIKQRLESWKLRVEGDYLSQAVEQSSERLLALLEREKRFEKKDDDGRLSWCHLLKRIYLHALKKVVYGLASRKF